LKKVQKDQKLHYWKQIESCSLRHCHSLYDVKEKLQLELCELLAILSELPTNEQGGFGKL
jgi:hypothetical protein